MRLRQANATYLQLDEAYHVWLAVPGFPDLWSRAHEPTHPPLLIILLHFWRKLSESEVWLRMIPVLSGVLFPWFVYRWLGLVWSRRAGLVAALLVIFSPPLVRLSSEVRAYTLALALTTAAVYCLEKALRGGGVRWMWGFAVLLWLGVFSEFPTAFFCVAIGLYVLLRWHESCFEWRSKLVWVFSQLVAVGIYFAYLFNEILLQRRVHGRYLSAGKSYLQDVFPGKSDGPGWVFLKGVWAQFHMVLEETPPAAIGVAAFLIALVLAFRSSSGLGRRRAVAWTVLMITPFLVVWLAVLTGSYPFGRSRHTIFLSLFIAAGLGITMDWMLRRKAALVVAVAAVLIPIWYDSMNYNVAVEIPSRPKEVMRSLVPFIRENVRPGDLLLAEGAMRLDLLHYLHPAPNEPPPSFDRGVTTLGPYRTFGPSGAFDDFDDVLESLREYRQRIEPPPGETVWVLDGEESCGLCDKMSTRTEEDWIEGQVGMWNGYAMIFPIDIGLDAVPPGWDEEPE